MAKSGTAEDYAKLTEALETIEGVLYRVKRDDTGKIVSQAGAVPLPVVVSPREQTAAEVARLVALDPKLAKTEDIAAMLQALLRRS